MDYSKVLLKTFQDFLNALDLNTDALIAEDDLNSVVEARELVRILFGGVQSINNKLTNAQVDMQTRKIKTKYMSYESKEVPIPKEKELNKLFVSLGLIKKDENTSKEDK